MNSRSEYNACDVFLMLQTNSILRHGLTCVFCNKIICAPLLNYKSIHSNTWKESIVKNKVWFRVNFNNFRVLQKCTYSDQYTFFLLKRLLCWCTCFQQGKYVALQKQREIAWLIRTTVMFQMFNFWYFRVIKLSHTFQKSFKSILQSHYQTTRDHMNVWFGTPRIW